LVVTLIYDEHYDELHSQDVFSENNPLKQQVVRTRMSDTVFFTTNQHFMEKAGFPARFSSNILPA
jgi:hypothetical protein